MPGMDNNTSIALSRMITQQRAIDVTANNIANASTQGYRAERMVFADFLVAQPRVGTPPGGKQMYFTEDRATYREQTEGAISHTGNPLDLALTGPGYFQVQTPAGPRLTRAGHFGLLPDGTIADSAGNALLDTGGQPMKVGLADTDLSVGGDGSLSSQNGPLGRIGVVTPTDLYKLVGEGNRLLRADTPLTPTPGAKVLQGAVEDSDVQPVSELVNMMTAQRDFQFVTQYVEAEGQRQQNAIDKIATPLS
jgi:flagellar basal-body rod protein FlgF